MKVKIKLLALLLFSVSSLVVAMETDIPASVKPIVTTEVVTPVAVMPVITALSIKFGTEEGVRTVDYVGAQAQQIADLLKNTDFFKSIVERWQPGEKVVVRLPEISKEQFERFINYLNKAQEIEQQKGEETALFFDSVPLDELYDVALTASFFGAHTLLKFVAPALAWQEMQQFKKTGNFSHYLRNVPTELTAEWVKFVPDIVKDSMPSLVLPVNSAQPFVHIAQEDFVQFPTVENGKIQFWDVYNGNLVQEIIIQNKPVDQLHMWIFDKAQFLLIQYKDKSFDVWDITAQQLIFSNVSIEDRQVIDVFHPVEYQEKNFIVTLYANGTAQVWDLQSNQEVVLLTNLTFEGEEVFVEWDAKSIIIGDQVLDYNNNILTTLDIPKSKEGDIIWPFISKNNERVVFIDSNNGRLNVVDKATGKNVVTSTISYIGKKYPIGSYDIANYIALAAETKFDSEANEFLYTDIPIKVLDLHGAVIAELDHDNEAVAYVEIVDDTYLLATTAKGSLFVWDLLSGKRLQKIALLEGQLAYVLETNAQLGLAIVYENNYIADPSNKTPGTLELIYYLIDFKNGTILNKFKYLQEGVYIESKIFPGALEGQYPRITPYGFISPRINGVIFTKSEDIDLDNAAVIYYLDKNYLGQFTFEQAILIELLKERHATHKMFGDIVKNSYIRNLFATLPIELQNSLIEERVTGKSDADLEGITQLFN